MIGRSRWRGWLLVALLAIGAAGCIRNPATGETSLSLVSEGEERAIGADQHPKVIARHGGVYRENRLDAYVADLGRRLAAQSEIPAAQFTFTLLDTPVVNAFALPGGYVYVTRGLLAMANSEAELAGVIGHEIGHVAARHPAQRMSQGMLAQIGAAALGVITGAGVIGDVAGIGAQGYIASFSREQELEADELGVRYMTRAGYDPYAQADFLATLDRETALRARIYHQTYDPGSVDFLDTHPASAERMRRAIVVARESGVVGAPRRTERYLRAIDGMAYGDSARQGYVRGRDFLHPELRIAFRVPPDFHIANAPEAVVAYGPNDAALKFDSTARNRQPSPRDYLATTIGRRVRLNRLETIEIDGVRAATAWADAGDGARVRLVVIDGGDVFWRLLFVAPKQAFGRYDALFRETAESFHYISAAEAAALRPLRLRVLSVAPRDTVASLARRMAFDDLQIERFRVLNGLDPGDALRVGQLVKIVSDR